MGGAQLLLRVVREGEEVPRLGDLVVLLGEGIEDLLCEAELLQFHEETRTGEAELVGGKVGVLYGQ